MPEDLRQIPAVPKKLGLKYDLYEASTDLFYSTFSIKNHMDNGCNPANLLKNSGFANLDDLFLIKLQETPWFKEQQV